jgi:hypothetical protein
MGAGWTVHQQRSAFNVGVPEMQRAALCVGRGTLLIRPRGTLGSPRPEPWLPYVFTSTEEAAEAGVL